MTVYNMWARATLRGYDRARSPIYAGESDGVKFDSCW